MLQDCYILQDDSEEDYYNADQVITLREFPNILEHLLPDKSTACPSDRVEL